MLSRWARSLGLTVPVRWSRSFPIDASLGGVTPSARRAEPVMVLAGR